MLFCLHKLDYHILSIYTEYTTEPPLTYMIVEHWLRRSADQYFDGLFPHFPGFFLTSKGSMFTMCLSVLQESPP